SASDVSPNCDLVVPPCTSAVAGFQFRFVSPVIVMPQKQKNRPRSRMPVSSSVPFSDLFNVAASRPANHHGISALDALGCLASIGGVIKPPAGQTGMGPCARPAYYPTATSQHSSTPAR